MPALHPLLLAMLLATGATAAEVTWIELKAHPFAAVVTNEGLHLEGTVIMKRDDGTLRFLLKADGKEHIYQPNEYKSIEWSRPAKTVVEEAAAQAIAAGNGRRTAEVLRWGLANDAKEAVQAAIGKALTAKPADKDVLAVAVPLWRERNEWVVLETAARAAIAADRFLTEADGWVVEALTQQGKTGELEAYAKQWLDRNPTSLTANLLCAPAYERSGNIRNARECFRKAWELGKSDEGALGYARTSLKASQFADARRAAQALIDAGKTQPEAAAWAAAAAAAQGDLPAAKSLLAGFDGGKVSAEAAQAGTYALGLIAWREGRRNDAAKAWTAVQAPAAQFALAIAQRREFAATDRLPPAMRATARLLNAEVRLEARQADSALQLIDPHLDGRHAFLYAAAQVVKSGGSPESVRALAAVNSAESKRWQCYGDLIAGRYDDAEAKARLQPPNDGYAMFGRVFILAAKGDPEGARLLFNNVLGLPGVPDAYVARLKEIYKTADFPVVDEAFDWPEGELLATGWVAQAPGTGIRIHAEAGKLVMEGTQTASEDPLSRAAIAVPGNRFRSARLSVDVAAAGRASVGFQLLDTGERNGVALAWRASRLAWRQVVNGKWSDWRDLPYACDGSIAVLTLDLSGGKVYAADPADPLRRQVLSDILAHAQGDWWISLFGTAEPGTPWKAGFDDLQWQLTPEAK